MKKYKFCIIFVLLFSLLFSACGKMTELSLGDGLPPWMLEGTYSAEANLDDAEEQGLVGIYTTDTHEADVYVYRYPKEPGDSLEAFGQKKAEENNVYCNFMTYENTPAAVLNYYEDDSHNIVQAYIFETDTAFVTVATGFKTQTILETAKFSFRMIALYEAQPEQDSPLLFDTSYTAKSERLPQVSVRRFYKDSFPVKLVSSALGDKRENLSLSQIVSLYAVQYDLDKGLILHRNGLDLAFIAYFEGSYFKTRAIIDDGEDYVMLSVDAETDRFQHITNALIDAIELN